MARDSRAEPDEAAPKVGAALRLGRAEFAAVFDHAPTGMCLTGLDGRFLSVNPVMCRMLGYEEEELLRLRLFEVTHPEDVDVSGAWRTRLLADPAAGDIAFEKRYLRKDGGVVWAAVRVHVLREADGRPYSFMTHVQDVTGRRSAEEALRESEEKFRIAFENAPTGMSIVRADGSYVAVNAALCQMLGYSAEELLAGDLHRVTHPDDVERGNRWIRKMIAGDLSEPEHEKRYLHRDGHVVWGVVRARWVRNADGSPRLAIVHVEDVTRRKLAAEERAALEAQLHQAQKMEAIGLLAGGVAHDFNNLLTAIGGNAALALADLPVEDPLHELLDDIARAAESAARLTRQLLAFSRKQVIAPRVLDLAEVVARLDGMLRRVIGEHIELRTLAAPQLGRVRVDPGQIEQILLNLSVNARDAMPGGGHLTIETRDVRLEEGYRREHGLAAAEHVLLAVSDDGAGMTDEVKRHLFEPFFTTKPHGKGTGLGLAMVYGAVKQNAGHIEVASQPGEGTTVRIYLPRVDAPAEAAPLDARGTVAHGTETVLVVEDDAMVRALAQRVLVRHGYRVIACASGEEALAAVRAGTAPVDLVVTDVVLTGMNGRTMAEAVRRLRPEVRVLFTSGHDDDVVVHHGVLEAGIEFLPKPYPPEQLARRVREVLDRAAR